MKTYVDYRDPHKSVSEIAREIQMEQIEILKVIGQGKFIDFTSKLNLRQNINKCVFLNYNVSDAAKLITTFINYIFFISIFTLH